MWQELMRTWLIGAAVTMATPDGALRADQDKPADAVAGTERNNTEDQLAMPRRSQADLYSCNEEPPVEELLADPVCHALMRYDGVSRETLTSMVDDWRTMLDGRPDEAEG